MERECEWDKLIFEEIISRIISSIWQLFSFTFTGAGVVNDRGPFLKYWYANEAKIVARKIKLKIEKKFKMK